MKWRFLQLGGGEGWKRRWALGGCSGGSICSAGTALLHVLLVFDSITRWWLVFFGPFHIHKTTAKQPAGTEGRVGGALRRGRCKRASRRLNMSFRRLRWLNATDETNPPSQRLQSGAERLRRKRQARGRRFLCEISHVWHRRLLYSRNVSKSEEGRVPGGNARSHLQMQSFSFWLQVKVFFFFF